MEKDKDSKDLKQGIYLLTVRYTINATSLATVEL